MNIIGIVIFLLPIYLSADVGFSPNWNFSKDNLLFNTNTTNNPLTLGLIQIVDTSGNNMKPATSFPKYTKEALGGFLGGFLVAFPGLLLASSGFTDTNNEFQFGYLLTGLVSAEIGAIIGVPIGVMIAGKKVGEKGSYWKTLAGTLIGNILGLGAGCLTYAVMDDLFHSGEVAATIVSGGIGGACSIAGAVWGYQW